MPLRAALAKSLELLKSPSLYCYMYHQFSDYQSQTAARQLEDFKRNGMIERIGVSVYGNDQLEKIASDPAIDVIQLPVNILDWSDRKFKLLQQAKLNGKEIHARSVFLQGLFMKSSTTVTGNLKQLMPYLEKIGSIADYHKMDIKTAALNFVIHKKVIDYVVLGVEQATQLAENLALIRADFNDNIFNSVRVDTKDMHLLNPANWNV